ncbi:hypothetical protein D3C78_1859750 [compost metagenome]
MRRLNGVHLERNVGGAGQHGIPLQRSEHRLRRADMGVELMNIIRDSVTYECVSGCAMLLCLAG